MNTQDFEIAKFLLKGKSTKDAVKKFGLPADVICDRVVRAIDFVVWRGEGVKRPVYGPDGASLPYLLSQVDVNLAVQKDYDERVHRDMVFHTPSMWDS